MEPVSETYLHLLDEGTSATILKQDGEALAQDGSMQPEAARPVAGGMMWPFKVRNFNLLFVGQTISINGNALYAAALPWLILTTGGNAQELGFVLAAYCIPMRESKQRWG